MSKMVIVLCVVGLLALIPDASDARPPVRGLGAKTFQDDDTEIPNTSGVGPNDKQVGTSDSGFVYLNSRWNGGLIVVNPEAEASGEAQSKIPHASAAQRRQFKWVEPSRKAGDRQLDSGARAFGDKHSQILDEMAAAGHPMMKVKPTTESQFSVDGLGAETLRDGDTEN